LDMSLEDRGLLRELVSVFASTELGEYRTNVSIGKNFGEMKKI